MSGGGHHAVDGDWESVGRAQQQRRTVFADDFGTGSRSRAAHHVHLAEHRPCRVDLVDQRFGDQHALLAGQERLPGERVDAAVLRSAAACSRATTRSSAWVSVPSLPSRSHSHDLQEVGPVAPVLVDHDADRVATSSTSSCGLLVRRAQRFLAQRVHAMLGRQPHHVGVRLARRDDVDGVERLLLEHLAWRGVHVLDPEFLRACSRALERRIAHRDDAAPLARRPGAKVVGADHSAAEHADAQVAAFDHAFLLTADADLWFW